MALCHIHNQVMATGNMDTNMAKSSGMASKLSKLTDRHSALIINVTGSVCALWLPIRSSLLLCVLLLQPRPLQLFMLAILSLTTVH